MGTSMTAVASGPRRRGARTPENFCQVCIEYRPLQNDGYWAPTREQWILDTCPVTWTSSCSVSTAAAHVAEGCCSTGSWGLLSPMDRFVTKTLL